MKLKAIIEKNEEGYFQIMAQGDVNSYIPGGFGHSLLEAKADFQQSLDELKEIAEAEGKEWPDKIDIDFDYDIPSLFRYFDCLNVSKFAKSIGINESKMRAYSKGLCNASESTTEKIVNGLRKLGDELSACAL